MRRRAQIATLVVSAALLVLASSMPAFAQTVRLRYSLIWPATHPITQLTKEWGEEVERATAGRVTVSVFAGNTLSPPTQAYDNVVKGVADMACSLLAYAPGRLPLSEVLQQPLGYRDGYQATMLANAFYQKFRPAEFNEVQVMYLHGAAPGFIMTKRPITTMAEIRGLRIKANAENADIVTNLGGAPVTMPVTETYDSVQRGVIDGTLFPIEALQGYRIGEVVKTVMENYALSYMTSFYVIMNKDKWNSISPADQRAIEAINQAYIEKQGRLWVTLDAAAKTFALSKGVTFLQPTAAEYDATLAAMRPILDKYVAMTRSKGLPGEEALRFCQDFLKQP